MEFDDFPSYEPQFRDSPAPEMRRGPGTLGCDFSQLNMAYFRRGGCWGGILAGILELHLEFE